MESKNYINDIQMFINEAYSDNEPLQDNQIKSKKIFNNYCNKIKQDLERLEQLEKENQEIRGVRMKFTSEDLMKAMGLKVGDRVKMPYGMDEVVCKINDNYQLYFEDTDNYLTLERLLNKEYEILPAPKRIGNLKCKDIECSNCPIRALINCNKADNNNQSLFDNLAEWTNEYTSFDQEIYDILKARLDRVVFERQDNMEVKQDERLD